MNNIKRFSSRKEVTELLKEKGIDTSNWSEEKWLKLNKGQAEIHMMALAEAIYDSVNESIPNQLKENEWHIPFVGKLNESLLANLADDLHTTIEKVAVKISTAMSARTSYTIVGKDKELEYDKLINLHDKLIKQDPPHSSPMEHCARAMSDEEYYFFVKGRIIAENKQDDGICDYLSWSTETSGWCNNLKGFIPYRYFLDNKYEMDS